MRRRAVRQEGLEPTDGDDLVGDDGQAYSCLSGCFFGGESPRHDAGPGEDTDAADLTGVATPPPPYISMGPPGAQNASRFKISPLINGYMSLFIHTI